MKTLLTIISLLIGVSAFGQKTELIDIDLSNIKEGAVLIKKGDRYEVYYPRETVVAYRDGMWSKRGTITPGPGAIINRKDGAVTVMSVPEKKTLEQHPDGRWFEVKKYPWIMMSMPAQQNVDTIWYDLKETGKTQGRITLK